MASRPTARWSWEHAGDRNRTGECVCDLFCNQRSAWPSDTHADAQAAGACSPTGGIGERDGPRRESPLAREEHGSGRVARCRPPFVTESPGQGDVRAEALRSKLVPGGRAPGSRGWPSHLIVLGGVASGGATDTAVEAVACGRPTQLCASPRTQREILSRAAESSLGFAFRTGGVAPLIAFFLVPLPDRGTSARSQRRKVSEGRRLCGTLLSRPDRETLNENPNVIYVASEANMPIVKSVDGK